MTDRTAVGQEYVFYNLSMRQIQSVFAIGEETMGKNRVKEGYFFSSRDLWKLIIPLIIEQMLAILVGMADSIMVASVGEAAVSGVSLVDTIFVLLINIFAALATGGAVVSGQYIGKKKPQEGCRAANQLVLFTGVFSVLIMLLLYLCKPFILHVVFGKIERM